MQRFCQEIHAALAHLERAQKAAANENGNIARLIIADRQLRAILDEEGKRMARIAALATAAALDGPRCERGVYLD